MRFCSPIVAILIGSENRRRISSIRVTGTPGSSEFPLLSFPGVFSFICPLFLRCCPPFLCSDVRDKSAWSYWLNPSAIRCNGRKKSRGNGHTRRIAKSLIADIWQTIYRQFYTPIAAIGENRNRSTTAH